MYTSDKKAKRSFQAVKTVFVYLLAAVICIVFNLVYSLFGHGVVSMYMKLAFLYPLAGGSLVFLLLWLFRADTERIANYRIFYNLYNSGIAALTSGSLLGGVFEIAGTSSPYTLVFFLLGGLLCFAGMLGFTISSAMLNEQGAHTAQ